MTTPTTPNPSEQSIGILLSVFLSDRREQITSEWIMAVHRDKKIETSDDLTHVKLKDHLPQLLDNLSDLLCNACSNELKEEAAYTSATHGDIRWKEGYDVSELIREFADLRSTILHHLIQFQEHHSEYDGASKLFTQTIVHRFLDNAIRVSVEQFIATQERAQPNHKPSLPHQGA